MNITMMASDQAADEVLTYEFSDEDIEAAAGLSGGIEDTVNCTWSVTTECNPCAD